MQGIPIFQNQAEIFLPRALWTGIQNALNAIFLQGSYADKAVAQMLAEHKSWGSRDRKTATKIIYELVRHYLLYKTFLQTKGINDTHADFLQGMVLATMAASEDLKNKVQLPQDWDFYQEIEQLSSADISLKYSFPKWWTSKIEDIQHQRTAAILSALDQPAEVYIRCNTVGFSEQETVQELSKEVELEKVDTSKSTYWVKGNNRLRQTILFKKGAFEFQDLGSQMIGHFCHAKPGQTLLDLCAGKGGKTLQLGNLMKNKGRIIASDIDPERLSQLNKRAKRAGLEIVEVLSPEALSPENLQADIVLVDAPCSGSGTTRRQPDLKFRLQESDILALLPVQAELLDKAFSLLRIGGTLVYATCSVFAEENQQQIEAFLQRQIQEGKNPELLEQKTLLPDEINTDGFFMAKLKK